MSRNRKLRIAFRNILEPFLRTETFVGKFPHYRRNENNLLHLISIVYDKYGGGFCLEFAAHPPGPLTTSWGAIVQEEDLDVAYVAPEHRARLVRTVSNGDPKLEYFRYDDISNDRRKCEELVASVVELFPQVNTWLRDKSATTGVNVSPFGA